MARKVYYSKPLKYFWHNLYGVQKKLTPNYSNDQIFDVLRRNIIAAPVGAFAHPGYKDLLISGLELWRVDAIGELLHLFFPDKHLKDFLENTKLSDLEGLKKFLRENGEIREIIYLYSKEKSNCVDFKFGLHLPYEAEGYAFSLSLDSNGYVELYFALGENGGRISDKDYDVVNSKTDEVSITIAKMFRLAINTIAYMNCFPDCVTDGVPQNLFERSEDMSASNLTLILSDKVRENENSQVSKIPHFRKGHFRYLKSDHFVNKKGQLVFIAETMVKGKAKTVTMSPKIDEFSNDQLGNSSLND